MIIRHNVALSCFKSYIYMYMHIREIVLVLCLRINDSGLFAWV